MSIIRILPEDVSNRIAAGEVIERPASVVKELVENSLDAGATQVRVYVERGGRSLIRVVDNGFGMDSEDCLLCLEAHATSKIRTADDVANVASLGFRGEALPSISSVSRFVVESRPASCDVGTAVTVEGGIIQDVRDAGCAPGTSITVRNLFFNVPARRKFLRSVSTEEQHIEEMILLQALAHADVGFELMFDDRAVISVQPGGDIRTRATMLLGKDTMANMLPVDYEETGIHVSGFVARPGMTRSTRREQRTFVNGRPVDAQTIYFAIRDAYHTLVMKGRYAPAILFVALPPADVDINVHPAKREVRFRDSRTVGHVVAAAVGRALRQLVVTPSVDRGPRPVAEAANLAMTPTLIIPSFEHAHDRCVDNDEPVPTAISPSLTPPPVREPSVSAANPNDMTQLRIIGSLADTFIVAEGRDGLVIIDQHAAHERVMFEQVLERARQKDGATQGLLIPLTLDLSVSDAAVLRDHITNLCGLGFDIEPFGGTTFLVAGVPPHFPQENVGTMLRDIIDDLRTSSANVRRADENQIAQAACKAAVKAHDPLALQEIQKLLVALSTTELPYTCPHGRPTMINVAFDELERRFGRRAPS